MIEKAFTFFNRNSHSRTSFFLIAAFNCRCEGNFCEIGILTKISEQLLRYFINVCLALAYLFMAISI